MKKPVVIGLRPRLDAGFLTTDALARRAGMNTGNLVYAHAICRHLADYDRLFDSGDPPEWVNDSGDVGVIQAANQLGSHFDEPGQVDRLAALEVGLVAIGLGAQSASEANMPELSANALRWLRHIADRAPTSAPNLAIRGAFTGKVLDAHGFADRWRIIGCPSLFLNPAPRLGKQIAANLRPPRRIAVAAGHQGWERLAAVEASLARLVTETDGSYVGQHGLSMMMLTRCEGHQLAADKLERCRQYICPEMDAPAFLRWARAHGNVFFDVPSWVEHYRRFNFVVGTRIHGTALALQAGVPALCVTHDSRTLELCRTMKVPYVEAADVPNGVSRSDLLALTRFDADEFDENRRMLCRRYVEFLKENQLRPVEWLERLGSA